MNVHNTPHGSFMDMLLRILKNFRNFTVNFLRNYKKELFSGHFVYKLENEEIYSEQIFFLPFHRFRNVLRPIKWWKRCFENVNQLDVRKFTIEPVMDMVA